MKCSPAVLVGQSSKMIQVYELIQKVAVTDVNVLISGESGTGKEVTAATIHRLSRRNRGPFVAVNCAAIPKDLLESELFGHIKGAFTGAQSSRQGLFEEAHQGTILLDEIGDLTLSLQAKLLRVLQSKQVRPVGSNELKDVNVRILSATHQNLRQLIQKGEFREDLYYRINVMPIQLPALRERPEDISLLAECFLEKHKGGVNDRIAGFTQEAIFKLQTLPWRGNVRELENAVERAMVICEGSWIDASHILVDEIEPLLVKSEGNSVFDQGLSLKELERNYIQHILKKTDNKKEAATRILGIDRKTLYRKEKSYGFRLNGRMVAAADQKGVES